MSGAKRTASPVIARNWARSERGTFGRATLIRRLPLRGRGLLASCLQMPTPQHNELVRLQAIDALDHRFDDPSEELLWQIISGLTPTTIILSWSSMSRALHRTGRISRLRSSPMAT